MLSGIKNRSEGVEDKPNDFGVLAEGLEPATCGLQNRCSAS